MPQGALPVSGREASAPWGRVGNSSVIFLRCLDLQKSRGGRGEWSLCWAWLLTVALDKCSWNVCSSWALMTCDHMEGHCWASRRNDNPHPAPGGPCMRKGRRRAWVHWRMDLKFCSCSKLFSPTPAPPLNLNDFAGKVRRHYASSALESELTLWPQWLDLGHPQFPHM